MAVMPFRVLSILICLSIQIAISSAEIRSWNISSKDGTRLFIDHFQFSHTVHLDLNVSQIILSNPNSTTNLTQIGFFLTHTYREPDRHNIDCPLLNPKYENIWNYTFDQLKGATNLSISTTRKVDNEIYSEYSLFFENCLENVEFSMSIRSAMYYLDEQTGLRSYIIFRKLDFHKICFRFFLIYLFCMCFFGFISIVIMQKKVRRSSLRGIHYLILVVFGLKAVSFICLYFKTILIKRWGHVEGLPAFLGLASRLLSGIPQTILALCICSGWLFVKPSILDYEKLMMKIAVVFQIGLSFLKYKFDMYQLRFFGALCYDCPFVFDIADEVFTIFSSLVLATATNEILQEAAKVEGQATRNLMKAKMFKRFGWCFLLHWVFRFSLSFFDTMTDRGYLVAEISILAFYLSVTYIFWPTVERSKVVPDDLEKASVVSLKKNYKHLFCGE